MCEEEERNVEKRKLTLSKREIFGSEKDKSYDVVSRKYEHLFTLYGDISVVCQLIFRVKRESNKK